MKDKLLGLAAGILVALIVLLTATVLIWGIRLLWVNMP